MSAAPMMSFGMVAIALGAFALLLVIGVIVVVAVVAGSSGKRER